ncbi:MAG: ChaN family lipoprotein [Bdellovibrionales bacterium]
MKYYSRWLTIFLVFLTSAACATTTNIYRGADGSPSSWAEVIDSIEPGTVVVVSEQHGFAPHHENQRLLLEKLGQNQAIVSVGLEFFNYNFQPEVDQYVKEDWNEEEFLNSIDWGKISFDHYRYQALVLEKSWWDYFGDQCLKELTRQISKEGLSS